MTGSMFGNILYGFFGESQFLPVAAVLRGMDFVTRRVKILVAHAKLLGDLGDDQRFFGFVNGWFILGLTVFLEPIERVFFGFLDLAYHDCLAPQ